MEFIITSSEIKKNNGANSLFDKLKNIAKGQKGYCYYKYPIAGGLESHLPDIVIIDLDYGVCAIDVYSFTKIDDIDSAAELEWTINSKKVDSPLLKLEDYEINLKGKYEKYRLLRGKVKINYLLIFPQIKKSEFTSKFKIYAYDVIDHFIFSDFLDQPYENFWKEKSYFENSSIKGLFLSVSQGAGRLNNYKGIVEGIKANKIGEAIKLIDTRISYLDKQQHAAAIQIPDGPQRIRGMAGTGKTIILTMKAAFLHSRYPNAKILYTFNTQSLYNQIRDLITKFYRDTEEKDPDWNNLLILHSWGGKAKEGVYSRACLRNSIEFIPLMQASSFSKGDDAFNYVCNDALKYPLLKEYDFVLMDEAQDFPPSYFQLIYRLTKEPKRIIFAYDELQSLNNLSISDTGDLFGYAKDGSKIVDFSKGYYEGGIEMDYVLYKSYRNPLQVLMTAHSIGLGLYNKDGYMQVIDNKEVWDAIGYEVIEGSFQNVGEQIIIERPQKNSISLANELYSGNRQSLQYFNFKTRDEEISWIANEIEKDVKHEGIEPHDIIVISLNQKFIKNHFIPLQSKLFSKGVPSIIPGIGGVDRDKFGEKGFVTLSTVYKAKGNEAFVVYIMAFDYLYDYIDFVFARNRAFTSISRSKGWCRISGTGIQMERAISEIKETIQRIPRFLFNFPDPDKIAKKLSQEEHARRLQEKKKSSKTIQDLLSLDEEAIELTEEQREVLRKKLGL
ncbi:DEAD/DEAH box helicase [Terrimonas alba]|uniref:DEAD/DEAH box helicase n=1 Tax=Terrimonas alba TaxID=3349636 RepID=UPI0035F304E5